MDPVAWNKDDDDDDNSSENKPRLYESRVI